jgi:hypothetical protein
MRISKSKFVAGVQCLKWLYLQVHDPGLASELGEARDYAIEQGHQVELAAWDAFPGGVVVEDGPNDLDDALQKFLISLTARRSGPIRQKNMSDRRLRNLWYVNTTTKKPVLK